DGGWVSTITASGTADRMASSEQMVDSPGRACVTGSGGGPATDSPSSVVSIMAPPATPRPAAVASGGTVRGYRVPGQPRDGGHLGESDVLSPETGVPSPEPGGMPDRLSARTAGAQCGDQRGSFAGPPTLRRCE